jgi:hypothetical protein
MPKYVGVLIIVMDCILINAVFGGCIDCKNMHCMNNINLYPIVKNVNFYIFTKYLLNFRFNFNISAAHTTTSNFSLLLRL